MNVENHNHTLHSLTEESIEALANKKKETPAPALAHLWVGKVIGWFSSMSVLAAHLAWFIGWIVWNTHVKKPLDEFPFVLLTTIVSLEAIMLSLLVLISQKREEEISEARNELDLHINLLSEQENTRMLALLDAIADKVGVDASECFPERTPRELVEKIEQSIQEVKNAEA